MRTSRKRLGPHATSRKRIAKKEIGGRGIGSRRARVRAETGITCALPASRICAIRAMLPIRIDRAFWVWQRISLSALMAHSFLLVSYRRVKVPGFRIRGSQRTKVIRFIWSTVGYCFLCIGNRLLSVAKSAVGGKLLPARRGR